MRLILRFILANPLAVLVALAILVFTGLYAGAHLPVDLFPDLNVPVVNIISHYPGAAPEDMELLIARPIEDVLRGLPGVKRVASTSVQGLAQVTVEFVWGTPVADVLQLVQSQLALVRGRLPAGVEPTVENIGLTLQEVVGYVVYGSDDSVALRTAVTLDVRNCLMGVPGVAAVEVLGGDDPAYIVNLNPAALAPARLTIGDVVHALQEGNQAAVAGFIYRGGRDYLARGDGRLGSIEDVNGVMVPAIDARFVPLRALAAVSAGRVPRHYEVRGDGRPAVAFVVRKQPGASTTRTVRGVAAAMPDVEKLLPAGTTLKKYYDQSEIIEEARSGIVNDLLLGAALSILALRFFLGAWRPTVIVATTIPLTFTATLAVLACFGVGLNVITMSALTLSVGMIVDDAIVVAESIHRCRQEGRSPAEAVIEGVISIAGPDASGTFTLVAAFLPLLLVTGLAALFLRPFGLTISTALLVSLVLSLTFVPVLLSRFPGRRERQDFLGARVLRHLDDALQRALKFCFRHAKLTLAVALLSLGLAGLGAFLNPATVLPPIDEGAILIEYVMPPGTSLTESNRLGDQLDRLALAAPDVACVYRRTGSPARGYQVEGVNSGELVIKLVPKKNRTQPLDAVMAHLRRAYASFEGVVFLYHQPTQEKIDESFSGLPALFGVTVYGPDVDTLIRLAAQVQEAMGHDPAVAAVVNNTGVRTPEIVVRLNPDRLALQGITAPQALTALQAAAPGGIEATRIVHQRNEIAVIVRLAGAAAQDPAGVAGLWINAPGGAVVPLSAVADISVAATPAAVTRLNGEREITLLADVNGSISALVARLRQRFTGLALPAGYRLDFTGQYEVIQSTVMELIAVLLAAVVLIYLIMAMQFRSARLPLAILVTVPFSLIGALLALLLTGQGLDVSVAMGAVTLVGIGVNNAILLLDYANKHAAEHASAGEAILAAASVRLRPILLTSLTTMGALVPTALSVAAGSHVFRPFAIAVIGGLFTDKAATLLLVPTLTYLTGLGGRAAVVPAK